MSARGALLAGAVVTPVAGAGDATTDARLPRQLDLVGASHVAEVRLDHSDRGAGTLSGGAGTLGLRGLALVRTLGHCYYNSSGRIRTV